MKDTPDYADGWPDRLRVEIRWRGFRSMRDLADQTAGQPLTEVSNMFGGRYAPFQVESVMRGEAVRDGWLTWFARDMLVRSIRWICSAGWSSPETTEFTRIRALVSWASAVDPVMGKETPDQIISTLRAEAPAGWEPSGADDPLITRIVQLDLSRVRWCSLPAPASPPSSS